MTVFPVKTYDGETIAVAMDEDMAGRIAQRLVDYVDAYRGMELSEEEAMQVARLSIGVMWDALAREIGQPLAEDQPAIARVIMISVAMAALLNRLIDKLGDQLNGEDL